MEQLAAAGMAPQRTKYARTGEGASPRNGQASRLPVLPISSILSDCACSVGSDLHRGGRLAGKIAAGFLGSCIRDGGAAILRRVHQKTPPQNTQAFPSHAPHRDA